MGVIHPFGAPSAWLEAIPEPAGCGVPGCALCRRLRTGAVELALRHGTACATMPAIAAAAGVPRRAAAGHYAGAEECVAAAFDEGVERLQGAWADALRGDGSWRTRLLVAGDAWVAEFERGPELARFCVVEAWRSDLPALRGRCMAARRRSVGLLAEHCDGEAAGGALPRLRFEMYAGAAHHLLSSLLESGERRPRAIRRALDELVATFEPRPSAAPA